MSTASDVSVPAAPSKLLTAPVSSCTASVLSFAPPNNPLNQSTTALTPLVKNPSKSLTQPTTTPSASAITPSTGEM